MSSATLQVVAYEQRWVEALNRGDAPAMGKRVRLDGLLFDRVENDRVVERWEQWDQPAMLRQLGF